MLYMVYKHGPTSYRMGRRFKTKEAAIRYAKNKVGGSTWIESYHGRKGREVVWTNMSLPDRLNGKQVPREFSGAKFA